MTEVTIENGNVVVRLVGLNKLLALKSSLTIPLDSITSVEYVPELRTNDYLNWFSFKIGTALPGKVAEGTFLTHEGKLFVNMHQGAQGIVLTLENDEYQAVVLEVEDAQNVYQSIRKALYT